MTAVLGFFTPFHSAKNARIFSALLNCPFAYSHRGDSGTNLKTYTF